MYKWHFCNQAESRFNTFRPCGDTLTFLVGGATPRGKRTDDPFALRSRNLRYFSRRISQRNTVQPNIQCLLTDNFTAARLSLITLWGNVVKRHYSMTDVGVMDIFAWRDFDDYIANPLVKPILFTRNLVIAYVFKLPNILSRFDRKINVFSNRKIGSVRKPSCITVWSLQDGAPKMPGKEMGREVTLTIWKWRGPNPKRIVFLLVPSPTNLQIIVMRKQNSTNTWKTPKT